MISLMTPQALLLLLFVPSGIILLRRSRDRYLRRIELLGFSSTSLNGWRWSRQVYWILAYCSLVVALARPVWGIELKPIEAQGISVVFILDVSKSMDAEDIIPSRLESAKRTLLDFFERLAGNELGLILFAGNSTVKFPLTTDSASLSAYVRQINSGSVTKQGTNIAEALQLGIQTLRVASKGKHLIILLSDGEGRDQSVDPVVAQAGQDAIVINSIGYGDTAGALIPIRNPDGSISDKRDAEGKLIYTALDESMLSVIAARTGGIYERADPGGLEVQRLTDMISQYVPSSLNRGIQVSSVEHFDVFVGIAVILFGIDMLMPRVHK